MKTSDIIPLETSKTLDGLFRERVRRSPEKIAYQQYRQNDDSWYGVTWAELNEMVNQMRTAFTREELSPGDRVAVMLQNSIEWVVYDQAALSLGLVVVPLFTNDRPDNIAYILNDANAKLFFIHGQEHWDELSAVHDQLLGLKRIVTLDPVTAEDDRVQHLQDWLPETWGEWAVYDMDAGRLASIVYTSGTTGKPKGVMLTHHNILWNAYIGIQSIMVYPDDIFLSFLPLSHMLERTVGYYLTMTAGAEVAFARSIPLLSEDLLTIKPTILISVPRIFERVYGKIKAQLEEKSPIARKLFMSAINVGWHRFERQQGRRSWTPALLFWPVLKKLVAGKVLAKLGGRLRFSICGGAALAPHISQTFIGLGLPIAQGYGLTETSPILSVNTLESNDPASVGIPLNDVEARIGDNDELLVKSPGVMKGYWNNETATSEVIDSAGWFHTGDKARIEGDHIYITGRIKEILVLANGEKLPPNDMETAILDDALFEQCIVIGEGRPYLSAVVVLNQELWPNFAAQHGVDENAVDDNAVKDACLQRIGQKLSRFPGYAQVRAITLLNDPWTVENEMLTPTLKTRRKIIHARYQEQIESMYSGH